MDNNKKILTLSIVGGALCIAPPAIATLAYFPLWVSKSSATTVSGLSMILVLISIVPIFKMLKEHLKTPAAPVLWAVVLGIAVLFRSIIDQVLVISFVGTISSVAGFLVFKVRDGMKEKQKKEEESDKERLLMDFLTKQQKE